MTTANLPNTANPAAVIPNTVTVHKASAIVSMLMGASFIFVVGFSHISVIHNAAHDTRHSSAFPCH